MLAVPGNRLLLKNRQPADTGVRDATAARFAAHGIDAALRAMWRRWCESRR